MLHGDYRLDNLLFDPDGADVVAVDWQTLAVGPPARDLAYFLGTSLTVDDRRAAERELVAEYHAALCARGVSGYDADQCFDDYRLGQLQGPMITTMGCAFATGDRSDCRRRDVPRHGDAIVRRDPRPRLARTSWVRTDRIERWR